MKIKNIKKAKFYVCNFSHSDINNVKYDFSIGEENKCLTEKDLIKEIKRIEKEIDGIKIDSGASGEVEETELSSAEVQEIENQVKTEVVE